MSPELRERILAYNKAVAKNSEKAADLDVIISAVLKLAPGQVKKFFNNKAVIAVLEKYGLSDD
jgi:hypothetical protein